MQSGYTIHGDNNYTQHRMPSLALQLGNGPNALLSSIISIILDCNYREASKHSDRYFTFSAPAMALLQTFLKITNKHGVFIDLLYKCPVCLLLLQHWNGSIKGG